MSRRDRLDPTRLPDEAVVAQQEVTEESLVAEVRALRLLRDQADARLYLRLMEIERDHLQLLLDGGHESFAGFLHNVGAVKAGRYEAFKNGVAKIGKDAALRLGVEVAIMAAATTDDKTQEYVKAADNWVADPLHSGLPTHQSARTLLLNIQPRPVEPRSTRRLRAAEKIVAENRDLRTENAVLRKKVKKLEAQVAKLTQQIEELKTKKS